MEKSILNVTKLLKVFFKSSSYILSSLKKPALFFVLFCCFFPGILYTQEVLKSAEEEYYDFLALQGLVKRPYLNYRTFSDSVWTIADNASHPWQEQNLGIKRQLFNNIFLRIYGPDLFASLNTTVPYGQNDGALWQGKGLNASLSGGVRLEGYGVELTFRPQLAFSQNSAFKILPSAYESEYGYFWAYAYNAGVDAPQRFGYSPFIVFDWGDSEIRYSWKSLTLGFGTQSIWLGPAYLNPILHSNNAPTYPKFDIGLRRQPVTIPWVHWYIGDIETRLWIGQLTESNYFDSNPSNDHTMFHGFAFAYAPSFLSGLTLFANRVCLAAWEWKNLKYIIPSNDNTLEDQKISFGVSWAFPQVGIEIFGEIGMDDTLNNQFWGLLRHPFHTTVYAAGLKKSINIKPGKKLSGEIIFEFNWMEMTQDFQFEWPYSFYFHHVVTHGYTNRGQWLGSGLGSGGNSQYLAFALYYPQGSSLFFVSRNNPDNNYLYKNAVYASAEDGTLRYQNKDWNMANFLLGAQTSYFFNNVFLLSGGIIYDLIINPRYERNEDRSPAFMHNFSFQANMKFML
jgi:hypothetical protein